MIGRAAFGPLVVIETPTRAIAPAWLGPAQRLGLVISQWRNRRYARQCERDALLRGEHPYAPSGELRIYAPAIAREQSARDRASDAWGALADVRAYYLDRGVCSHMRASLREVLSSRAMAEASGLLSPRLEFRTLRPRRSWVPSDAEQRAFTSDA